MDPDTPSYRTAWAMALRTLTRSTVMFRSDKSQRMIACCVPVTDTCRITTFQAFGLPEALW